MKTVYIIHGWEGSPNEPIIQWLKQELESRGYNVTVPFMPNPENPRIESWVGKLKQAARANNKTIFVGHSIGCQTILRYLQTLPGDVRIAGLTLIAPWLKLSERTLEEEGEETKAIARPWEETPIDFEKVKTHTGAGKIIAIFSDNDPYVSLDQKEAFEKELGARSIIEHNKGHFAPDDGVKELPTALNAVLKL